MSTRGIQSVPGREPPVSQVHDELLELCRILLRDEEEILRSVRSRGGEVRELAPIYPVSVRDDPALRGLTEDRGQTDGRNAGDAEEVSEDGPRPDRGELICVPTSRSVAVRGIAWSRW